MTILSRPGVKGTLSPSNSIFYIGGMHPYRSKTWHGLSRSSGGCSRGKIGVRYGGPMLSVTA